MGTKNGCEARQLIDIKEEDNGKFLLRLGYSASEFRGNWEEVKHYEEQRGEVKAHNVLTFTFQGKLVDVVDI